MFHHVVVGLDLSPAADAILRCLPKLRDVGTERLTLVHVAEVDYPDFGSVTLMDHHRQKLDALAPDLRAAGFQVDTVASAGKPAAELRKIADECDASLMLVGTQSRGRISDALLGSTAWDTVRNARIPVLLQRIDLGEDRPERGPVTTCWEPRGRIILPVDFTETAERAVALAVDMAGSAGRSFTLVHVRAASDGADAAEVNEDRERLNAIAGRLLAAGAVDVAVQDLVGDPATELLRLAEGSPESLIVMGTKAGGLIREAVLGSVSREIVRQGRGPVLLVPPKA